MPLSLLSSINISMLPSQRNSAHAFTSSTFCLHFSIKAASSSCFYRQITLAFTNTFASLHNHGWPRPFSKGPWNVQETKRHCAKQVFWVGAVFWGTGVSSHQASRTWMFWVQLGGWATTSSMVITLKSRAAVLTDILGKPRVRRAERDDGLC